jgi:PAS domain S-box-containing protein
MPEAASQGEPPREALIAADRPAGACLLRREGADLVAEPLPGGGPGAAGGAAGGPSGAAPRIPLAAALGGLCAAGAPPSFATGPSLAPLRPLVGPLAGAALLRPVPPPSPLGGYQRYLLVWSCAEDDPGTAAARLTERAEQLLAELDPSGGLPPAAGARDGFRDAFEASTQGLLLVRPDGLILRLNRAAARAAGPARTLREGDPLLAVVGPEAAERLGSLMQTARAAAVAAEEIDLAEKGEAPRLQHVTVDAFVTQDEGEVFLVSLRDLTERDRLVELLRREKDFTRSLLEAANACVLGLDVQGRTILFNKVFQDLTGYRLAEILGREYLDVLVPEAHRAAWRETHLRALEGESVADQDFRVRTRTGEERVVSLSAGRINDARGACRGVLWTGRDVTLERRREAELRAREETTSRSLSQLKEFSRISSMILQEKDLDSVCRMFVNALSTISTFRRAILTLCDADFRGYQWYFAGLTDEEIETFHRNKMSSRERITIFQERFRLGNSYYIPHTECWHYEGVRSHASSQEMVDWHPDDFLFIPLYGTNRKIVGIVSVDDPQDGRRPTAESISPLELFANQVAHSIEERKLDQEVRQSTERYRTLVETMHDGIITVDLRERIVFANAALAHLVGVPEPLLTGRPLGALLDPEDLAVLRNETALHGGGRVTAFEMTLRSQSGEKIPVHVSASPFREDGVLQGCFAVVRDLREQKKAEAERRAMQEQLMQAEKLSALGELISGIAHELNNPLTGVMGYSQLLLGSAAAPEAKKEIEKIHREAVRCQKIVQNLLTFARRRAPERKTIDLNALVDATLELRAYQLKVDGIEVVRELDENLPPTLGDFHQLQQVFLNIINNAHHALLEAGRPGRLVIRTSRGEGVVRVAVADNGPGISEEHLKKIFDPFFTTKEIGKGTGLGLSLSYGIVKEHEGRIEVASRPGAGATFTVELPIREEPAQVQEAPAGAEAGLPAGSRSILVVDDEETILELLEAVLQGAGHRVETASNGRQALEKIRKVDYDIIITDVKMPDMGGQKLYESVSEIKPHLKRRPSSSAPGTRTSPSPSASRRWAR